MRTDGTRSATKLAERYVQDFGTLLRYGTGLMLFGAAGTGKTHLATAVLTEIIRSGHSGAFSSARDFFSIKRPGYSGSRNAARLEDVDLLVLDDVGASRGTEWEIAVISDLLSARYDAALPTIVTTNLGESSVVGFIGDRAIDRFNESMLTARLAGESYRSSGANADSLRDAPPAILEPLMLFETEICYFGKMVLKRRRRTHGGDESVKVRADTVRRGLMLGSYDSDL